MDSKKVDPRVNMMFNTIIIAIVPTIGPMALFTNEDIIKESDATTSIESRPIAKAHKNLHRTSS